MLLQEETKLSRVFIVSVDNRTPSHHQSHQEYSTGNNNTSKKSITIIVIICIIYNHHIFGEKKSVCPVGQPKCDIAIQRNTTNRKKYILDTCRNMDEPQKHYAK